MFKDKMVRIIQGVPAGLISLIVAMLMIATPASADDAEEIVTYELTIDISWSAETHPFEFPLNAHLSSFLAATHNSRYSMFRDGDTASSGLELVAENGRPSIMNAELAEAQRRKRVGSIVQIDPLRELPGQVTMTVTTTKSHPFFSFVSMIAPSPDWFTGAADVALVENDEWIETQAITLWAWDSGTDGGDTFRADNLETQPQQSIRLLATPHFLTASGLAPIGRARLRKLGE